MSNGHSILFNDDACVITNKNSSKKVSITMMSNKMFLLDVSNMESFTLVASANDESKLWHLRYGHLNIKGLKLLVEKGMVLGLPNIDYIELFEGCIYEKQTWKSLPVVKVWRASKCLELIDVDLCGPMHTRSFSGSRYFLLFTDDCRRMSWVYFLETKSETFQKFKYFKARIEKQSGLCIKTFCTDRGREFLFKEFNLFLVSKREFIGS